MSGVLDGFEVIDIEESAVKSRMGKVIMAFLESGNECMGKRYEDMSELVKDVNSGRQFIYYKPSRRKLGVRVCKRGDMLVLMRKGGEA